MKKQKGFVLPMVIAIITVLAIGGGYYYTQKNNSSKDNKREVITTDNNEIVSIIENNKKEVIIDNNETSFPRDEIKNWKIYRNEEYGFEIKYPSDWDILLSWVSTTESVGTIIIGISGEDAKYSGVQIILISDKNIVNKYNSINKYSVERNGIYYIVIPSDSLGLDFDFKDIISTFKLTTSPDCLRAGEEYLGVGIPTDEDLNSFKSCCPGLSEISTSIIKDEGQCIEIVGGYGYKCSPCGNNVCEANYGENNCTCPLDCK